MSNLTQEIIALEQNRQAIVDAVNAKGGELAENAPLNAIAPAIEALPSGGGLKVLEGEITLATRNNRVTITHNLGVVPLWCDFEVKEPQEPIFNYVIKGSNMFASLINTGGVWIYNSTLVEVSGAISDSRYIIATDTTIGLFSTMVSRYFYPATYKYKIYYL